MGHSLLHRYWFDTKDKGHLGFGVTAYSVEDATTLVDDVAKRLALSAEVIEIVEDVDVRDLDQNHVVPNMGPPNFRGVWISGCKKDGLDSLYTYVVEIDEDVREEYWVKIRNKPELKETSSFKCLGKYSK